MPRLAIAQLEGKGRCVFAAEKIAKGEAIATDCVVLAPKEHYELIGPPLACYPLAWDDKQHALVLGVISLVNHSEQPNCRPERDFSRLLLRLVATRDIEAGEEITYEYRVPLWFSVQPPAQLSIRKDTQNGTPGKQTPR